MADDDYDDEGSGGSYFATTQLPFADETFDDDAASGLLSGDKVTTNLYARSTYYSVIMPTLVVPIAGNSAAEQGALSVDSALANFSRVPFFVADSLLTLFAMASNVLIVIAISKTKLSTPMVGYHRFILSLTVSCLIATSTIALSFVHEIAITFLPYPVLTRKCGETFLRSFLNAGFCGALLSISGLTLDSFIGMFFEPDLYATTTKRRTREITFGIWLLAIAFGLTDLPLSMVHFFSTGGHKAPRSRDVDFFDWCSVYIANKYRLDYALLGAAMPFFVFTFGTLTRLAVEVRRADVCWSPTNPDRRWVFRRFVTTTYMLMGLFAIFWMPYAILDVSIVLVTAAIPHYTPPNEHTLNFVRHVLRSWLLLGLLLTPVLYAIRFRRRVRRQLVDFFSAVCGVGDVNIPEIAEDEADTPTIRHLLACSSLVGYAGYDDSRGSFRKKDSRRQALSRVKSCRV